MTHCFPSPNCRIDKLSNCFYENYRINNFDCVAFLYRRVISALVVNCSGCICCSIDHSSISVESICFRVSWHIHFVGSDRLVDRYEEPGNSFFKDCTAVSCRKLSHHDDLYLGFRRRIDRRFCCAERSLPSDAVARLP